MAQRKGGKGEAHRWEFKARFRRHALSEIKKVARKDPLIGAEGAVTFLERISPAIGRVDISSGAIGAAVNLAIDELVPIIGSIPADATTRQAWLERLWEAHKADQMPYVEQLGDYWGTFAHRKTWPPHGQTACSTSLVWRSIRIRISAAIFMERLAA